MEADEVNQMSSLIVTAIANHLNILPSSIEEIQEWDHVLWVRFKSGSPRFVSKKALPRKKIKSIQADSYFTAFEKKCIESGWIQQLGEFKTPKKTFSIFNIDTIKARVRITEWRFDSRNRKYQEIRLGCLYF